MDSSSAAGDSAAGDSGAGRIRIGHAERDAVIEQLRVAAGEGRLTVDELTERMEHVVAAKTFADLDPIVADLPVPPPSAAWGGAPGSRPGARGGGAHALVRTASGAVLPAGDGPGWDPADPLVIRASWEDDRRRGRWRVPPLLRVETPGSTVELNFLEVEEFPEQIDIELKGAAGSCVLVVPDGWGVDITRVNGSWGTKKSAVDQVPRPGLPLITVRGVLGMSSLTARYANWFDKRRIEKRS